MHDLEAALGSAAAGRESSWQAAVLAALVVLEEATDDEYANAINPDSLLSDINRSFCHSASAGSGRFRMTERGWDDGVARVQVDGESAGHHVEHLPSLRGEEPAQVVARGDDVR